MLLENKHAVICGAGGPIGLTVALPAPRHWLTENEIEAL